MTAGPRLRFRFPQSLRGQFLVAVVVLSVLILVGGVFAVQALRDIAEISENLARERLQQLETAQQLVRSSLLVEKETYRLLTAESVGKMQKSYGEIQRQLSILDDQVSTLGACDTSASGLCLHQSCQLFRNISHIVVKLRQNMLEVGANQTTEENVRRFQDQLEIQVAAITSAAGDISTHLTEDYREYIRELAATSKRDRQLVFVLMVAVVLSVWIIFHYFLGRHVVGRLRQVSSYLRGVETADEQMMVPVRGRDEIGSMARAVEQFLEDRRQLAATKRSLQESEEMLRGITDAVQSGVVLIDDQYCIRYVNPAVEVIFGYGRVELIGTELKTIVSLEDFFQEEVEEPVPFTAMDENSSLSKPRELLAKHKKGVEIDVLVQVGRIYRNNRWWLVGSFIDITERKAAEEELKKAHDEVAYAAKMAGLGQLAAGIAHEINTPAQFVSDNLRFIDEAASALFSLLSVAQELLVSTLEKEKAATFAESMDEADIEYLEEELPSAIKESKDGMVKVSRIVQSMKEFSDPSGTEKRLANINKAIENAVTITQSMWKQSAAVNLQLDPLLPEILCNIGGINQVLFNIIMNAAQAIEQVGGYEKGEILVATKQMDDEVLIRISDNGGGIADEICERIFEPFFTTKPVGEGTGQGLAICYDIVVNKHGGRIEVTGAEGHGAIFSVYLPVNES